jgi:hypothetical protein
MKPTKIDLSKPFEAVLGAVLSLPGIDDVIGEALAQNRDGSAPHHMATRRLVDNVDLKEVVRCLYEAAHGRHVETQIGAITIAPAIAPFLKDTIIYAKPRVDFLLDALTTIICAASHSNRRTPASRRFAKRHGERRARMRSEIDGNNGDMTTDITRNHFHRQANSVSRISEEALSL